MAEPAQFNWKGILVKPYVRSARSVETALLLAYYDIANKDLVKSPKALEVAAGRIPTLVPGASAR